MSRSMIASSKLRTLGLVTFGRRAHRKEQRPTGIHVVPANMVGFVRLPHFHSLAKTSAGAPECYRFHEFMERIPIDIEQTVDIWSLGCVLSEVAVWLVHDTARLEAYRQERQDDTSRLFEFKDGRAFHDGQTVLPSVSSMHEEVLKNVRKSDYVTKPVVRKMITEMLDEADGRPNTKQLFRKSENILRDAKKKLTSTTKEQPEPEMHPQRRTPPIVPPQSQNNPTICSGGPGRWSPLRHIENRRSVTIDVLARDDRHSPEATADAEYESPDELFNPTEISPTGTSLSYPGDRSQDRRQLTNNNAYQSNQQAQQSSLRDLGQNHSPTPPGKVSTRYSSKHNSDGPDQLQDRSFPTPMSGAYMGDLKQTSSKHPDVGYLPSPQVESGPLQPRFVQTTNTTQPPPSSPTCRATRPLPYTSLVDAENWMYKKKQNGTNWPPLKHSEYLEKLKERDHVSSFSCPLVQKF
jgi:hypothetical protein